MKKSNKEEILKKLSNHYIEFKEERFDEDLTNYLSNFFSNYCDKNKKIIFNNCVFKGNLRIDNIKCERLEFKNCKFLDGGGIKNRSRDNALYIKNFVFKPYELEGDFVIDLGAYVDENGLINNETGCIEKLEFENHQKGNGRIFFVGLNDKLQFGNFRNRILDDVIFENCDLSKCTFLNSKVDKTEFRNVIFNKLEDIDIIKLDKLKIEKVNCFITFIFFIFFLLLPFLSFPNKIKDFIDYIIFFVITFGFVIYLLGFIAYIDSCYIKFLSCVNIISNYSNNIFKFFTYGLISFISCLIGLKVYNNYNKETILVNAHIATYDEELILNNLNNKNNYSPILESFKALTELYDQLAINFLKTNKQLWGEFMYSSKFYKSIFEDNYINIFPNKLNHLINGYGRRWFRALGWILVTIFFFGYVFTYIVKPNIDYFSTKSTSFFLLQDVKFDDKKGIVYYNSKSFIPFLKINSEFNKDNNILKKDNNILNIENNLYGYDNRFNFNNLDVQYILKLKINYWTGLCKSFSNLLYPFSFENKKWFENVTSKAFILSIIESIILWLLILALIRALWNVIVY